MLIDSLVLTEAFSLAGSSSTLLAAAAATTVLAAS